MAFTEKTVLLHVNRQNVRGNRLSLFFAVVCIIDVFGVFPIITLPKTIINCGVYGLLVVFVICSTQIYTAILLGQSWLLACKMEPSIVEKDRYPYSAMVELTLGRKLSKCVAILLNITIFGGGIPNLIVASQNLNIFTYRLFGVDISYCWWILVIGILLCPILWLGSPKDMKFLCSLSVFTVISAFLLVSMSLLRTANPVTSVAKELESNALNKSIWTNIAIAYGVLSFQFDIHPTILAIQIDMEKRHKVKVAIMYGFGVSLMMFLVIYVLAYAKFGINVNSSILESLPTSILLHSSVLMVAFQLCLSLGISNSALYQNLEDYVGISKEFNYQRCLLRTVLTVVAIVSAEYVPEFDLVMSVIGGTLTGPLVFIFPPVIYLKLLSMESEEHRIKLNIVQHPAEIRKSVDLYYTSIVNKSKDYPKLNVAVCYFVLGIGISGTIATTYVNIISNMTYSVSLQPCIYNISLLY